MALIDTIARGGRPVNDRSLGDIATDKQKLAQGQESLDLKRMGVNAKIEELQMSRQKLRADMKAANLDYMQKKLDFEQDEKSQEVISKAMFIAQEKDDMSMFPSLALKLSGEAGLFDLHADIKEAYATTGGKPKSAMAKIQHDLDNAIADNDTKRAEELRRDLESEQAKNVTAEIKMEENADEQAWNDLSKVFDFETEYAGLGDEPKEPDGYEDLQNRYKQLLVEVGPAKARVKILTEFEIDSSLGDDKVVRKAVTDDDLLRKYGLIK